MFSESKGGEGGGRKKQEGRKGLFQVEVHGSADHPFTKHCSEEALRGAEDSTATSLLGEQDVSGGCWREAMTGEGGGGET